MNDKEDIAHYRDPATRRSRWELRTMLIIVALVVAGGLVWRTLSGREAAEEKVWAPASDPGAPQATAAARGVPPGPATDPVLQPAPASQ